MKTNQFLAVIALTWFTSPVALAAVEFSVSTLETGVSVYQQVLPAALRGTGRSELVVVTLTDDAVRRLRVYELGADDRYNSKPLADVLVPEDVVIVDVGRLGSRDVIVYLTHDRAMEYDPFTDTVRSLVSFRTIYNVPMKEELSALDQFRDLNDDGLDDFIIPDFSGYAVMLQQPGGTFSKPVAMRAPPVMEVFSDNNVWYQPRIVFHTDLNHDQRSDLAFWVDDAFAVYFQLADGSFSGEASRLESNVPFEFDGISGVSFRMGEEDQSDLTVRALQEMRDIDGDDVADLVTLTVESKGVFKKQTTYSVHRGTVSEAGAVRFSSEPDSEISSNGIQFEMEQKDLNRDGQLDVIVSSVQLGVTKIIGALITGNIDIDLNFFQMADGVYPAEPNASREITASFDLSSGDVFFPFVLIADVNGDEYADLLVQDGTENLKIYEGEPGAGLFGRRSIDVKVELPNEPELVQLADLNNDGRQDVVMRIQKKNKPNRITVLIAR